MDVGTRLKLEIEKCVFSGDGLAHVDGQVVFVPNTLPGEVLIAEVTAVKKSFLRAKAIKFGTVSPHRVESACPAFGRCPGCAYMQTTYAYETELKQQQLCDFLATAGIEPELPVETPIAPPPELGYRNKITLHVNKEGRETMIGYVGSDKQTVTPIDHCPLAHPAINELLAQKLADPGFRHSVHNRMDVTLRYTESDGAQLWRNNPPRNASWLKETTSLGLLAVPADGFFQVNTGGADSLIAETGKLIDEYKPYRFIDLYCGAGLFSCVAAERGVPEIYGAELNESSVAAARYNLKRRGREDAKLFVADAVKILPELIADAPSETLLAVDPPRTGLALKMAFALGALEHGTLLYISCHPATWARDAARLAKGGWKLRQVRLVNQFAKTAHFELFSYFVK